MEPIASPWRSSFVVSFASNHPLSAARSAWLWSLRVVVVLAGVVATQSLSTGASAAECAASSSAADLDAFFSSDDAAGLAGADYPHVIALPDGRFLWYFQDAFFGTDGRLLDDDFAHNAALVQDGDCFEVLDPPGGDGDSWIGSWVESSLSNWLWPLDAEVGVDGDLWLFLAEVQNSNDTGAARGALPVGTWIARYTLPELQLVGMEPAPDPSRSLFGYSVVSDSEWSYVYGHCYRQFDEAGLIGFDSDCSPHAYLGRVPLGEFDRELEYWTSNGWSDDRDDRLPVMSADLSMPVSVQRFGDVYVAVSDENDWFGPDIVVYTSPAPQGPWHEAARYTPDTRCGDGCNNYGAFLLPELEGDDIVVAHSNNAIDMTNAFADASLYRSSVRTVEVPGVSADNLTREPDLDLARAEPEDNEPEAAPVRPAVAAGRAVAPATVAEPVAAFAAVTIVDPLWSRLLIAGLASVFVLVAATFAPITALGFARSTRRARHRRRRVLDAPSASRRHGADGGASVRDEAAPGPGSESAMA